ncbi:MAG: ATPase, T2SS/T4P/T4SS family [Candidatus Izemoplasmatales bacterium]|jgi:type IV pilus assembly protein PilB|nr:ATPase, T2SS/T4P/T4SS family [Candidatus Izemoplasmatales bacterium]
MNINAELSKKFLECRALPSKKMDELLALPSIENKRIDLEIIEQNLVSDEMIARVYAEFFGMRYEDINLISANPEIVSLVTQDFVDKYSIIPLNERDGFLLVALSDPFDYEGIMRVQSIENPKIELIVSTKKKINAIKNLVFSRSSTVDAISNFTLSGETSKTASDYTSDLYAADIKNAPAVRLSDSFFREAVAHKSSDIHIEPFENLVRVRYRVDGMLYEASSFGVDLYPAVLTRIKIISGINIAKKRIPQDGRIKQKVNDIDYDFRVSTLPTIHGEKIVIRLLDTDAYSFERPQLGFLKQENVFIDKMLKKPHGIILLTGPTGCGKSTTLYSFIKELNSSSRNIITVEDPVEYSIEGVNQVQVNPQADLTFARALRSILRQDPNVIMIGEIRDEETAQIAIRAAITGHLVLSTLHTNDAPGSISRLLDMNIEPYFVADAIIGIVAQRLVRRLCLNCRRRMRTKEPEMHILGLTEPAWIYQAKGCPACNYTGYKGRLGVHEVLTIDESIKNLIQIRASTEQIRDKAIEHGMMTLYETTKQQVLNGLTTLNELSTIIYEEK